MIYVFGDSHARIFSGIMDCKVHWLGPITMHRVGRDGIDFLDIRVYGIKEGDVCIYVFGEIDARCHIGQQRDLHGRDEDEVIQTLVQEYIKVIKQNQNNFKQVISIVRGLLPPTNNANHPLYPQYGALSERIRITKKLNDTLKSESFNNDLPFFDVYDLYSDKEGKLNNALSDNNVHIGIQSQHLLEYRLNEIIFKQSSSPHNIHSKKTPMLKLKNIKSESSSINPEFLEELKDLFNINTFIETGTYLGDTAEAASKIFDKVYTIELSQELYKNALSRFENKPNVTVLRGDSSEVLADILSSENGRLLVWLDAHYSEGNTALGKSNTPILDELKAIKDSGIKETLILIDDIRLFQENNTDILKSLRGYPAVSELQKAIHDIKEDSKFIIFGDIAIGLCLNQQIEISSILEACTVSRAFDGNNYNLKEVFDAERRISQADAEEKEVLQNLPGCYQSSEKYGIGGYYRLWKGLILYNDADYLLAKENLTKAKQLGFNHWRVDWHLAWAAYKAGKLDEARQAINNVVNAAPDFEEANALQKRLAPDKNTEPDKPQSQRRLNNDIDVSIVVATNNCAELLDEMLISLEYAAQGVRYEVIVVKGGSDDDTLEVLKSHGIEKVYSEAEYLGGRRHTWPQLYNFGLSQANGRWVMYASDNIVFEESCISRALKILKQQPPNVAGGIFFYKNEVPEPGWDDYGIDYTFGQKMLMNYGLIRLDQFYEVGGLDEEYKFYCADGDLCFKLYENGKKLIPLSDCFVTHNNVMDCIKQAADASEEDIRLYMQRWGHYGAIAKEPAGRRLMWNKVDEATGPSEKTVGTEAASSFCADERTSTSHGVLNEIKRAGLWTKGQPLRLHLGCGQQRFEGYINIDYPPSEHTVQTKTAADFFADIAKLSFPPSSVNEIRSHHVFEHFDRSTELALLCKWHEWLVPDGLLIIETPDLEASIQLFNSKEVAYKEKQCVLRHLFGSHEARWAVHMDGWYSEKFKHVLTSLGFEIVRIEFGQWKMLRNITVTARKLKTDDRQTIIESAKKLLRDNMVDESSGEERKWEVWCRNFEQAIARMHITDDNFIDRSSPPPVVIGEITEEMVAKEDEIKVAVDIEKTGRVAGIVFSKDRAMQLDALLRSFYLNCKDSGLIDLKVIYKVSNLFHKSLYNKLQQNYNSVHFIAEQDFKNILITGIDGFEYVLFMVDDNIFTRDFRISDALGALSTEHAAIGFSLRLGTNITYHYPSNTPQPQPEFIHSKENILKFDWTEAGKYFAYPLEVSSSVYRTKDLMDLLKGTAYHNPNSLESELAKNRDRYASENKYLLCFNHSVAFCNPANIVQDVFTDNRKEGSKEYSSDNLARLSDEGFIIDINKYRNLLTNSCHQEAGYDLIKSADADYQRLSNTKIYYNTPDIEQLGFDNNNSDTNGEAALLPHIIKPDDVVFDIGANQGEWSRKVLTVQPKVNLYAFEPVKSTFDVLKENLFDTKVNIYNIAFSGRSGKKTFYHYNQSSQSARMSTFYRRNSVEEDLNIQPVPVRVTTKSLASFCKSVALKKINFLKIDTEGAELDVLKGAAHLLKNGKIEAMQFEYGGTYTDAGITLKEICALLTQYGYIIFRILPDGLAHISSWRESLENYRYSNYLAVSRVSANGFELMKGLSPIEKKDFPVVSIYMAVYNSEKYIAQTLDSILNQTFRGFELVIADDGSMDSSLDILKQYASNDKRIKLLKLKHSGVVNARNKAIKKCSPKSKYFMNHDSDDISLPDKLERLVECLEEHLEISIAGCFAEYFDDEGNNIGQPQIEWKPEKIRQTFGNMNSMIHSASLIRRKVFKKIGFYNEGFPAAQDYDFFSRALMAGFEMANIPEVMHMIRLHPQSIGRMRSQLQSEMANKVQSNYIEYLKGLSAIAASDNNNNFLTSETLFKESVVHNRSIQIQEKVSKMLMEEESLHLLLNISRNDNLNLYDILNADSEIAKTDEDNYRIFINKNKTDGFPHMWLGLVLWNNCKYEEAWKEIEAAETLGAPEWRTRWYKSLIIRDNHAKWGWQNYELARELVSKVISLRPEFKNATTFQLYLNGYYSQWGQDVLIEDFFHFNPPRYNFFVDVGAYDGITLSNTYHFSKTGWDGLCIEPVSENYDKLLSTHKDSGIQCVRMAVSITEGEVLISIQGTGSAISNTENSNTEKVMSAKLSSIIDDNNIKNIDLLSIDAEERDFEVLQSIDLNKFTPQLIVIEYNSITSEKKKMIDYLAGYNYLLWHDNVQDLFFRRNDTVPTPNFWLTKTLIPLRPDKSKNDK